MSTRVALSRVCLSPLESSFLGGGEKNADEAGPLILSYLTSTLTAQSLLHGSHEVSCPRCEPCACIPQRSTQSAARAARAAMAWRRRVSPRACRWALSTTSRAGQPSQSYSCACAALSGGCGAHGGCLCYQPPRRRAPLHPRPRPRLRPRPRPLGLRPARGGRRTRCPRRAPCDAG